MCIPRSREFKLEIGHSKNLLSGETPISHILIIISLESPVKRDAYAEIVAKHNDLIKRGEFPGSGHVLERRQNDIATTFLNSLSSADGDDSNDILFGNTPTISPAVALDEDGQDISMFISLKYV
jgi:hypothetical protein